MNIIDIRPGRVEEVEGVRFSNADYNGAVIVGEACGELQILTQDNIDCDDGPAVCISHADIPAFFAAIRKGIELGWFPPFEPEEPKPVAPPKAPVARKATATKAK